MSANKPKKEKKPYTNPDYVNSLFDALPWLREHYRPEDYEKAKILPFDREIMDHLCQTEIIGSRWWFHKIRPQEQICLYSETGAFLGQVGFIQNIWAAVFGNSAVSFNVFDETVREGMIRVEKAPGQKVRWAVGVYKDDERLQMIVGKVPQDWQEVYRAETEKALAAAKAQVAGELEAQNKRPELGGDMLVE